MNKLSFYEQTGILIPGSVFVFGTLLLLPEFRSLFTKEGITVGGLGLFVLIAYAAGHLIAAVGNALETIVWKLRSGMPSDWITHADPRIVSTEQVLQIETRVRQRLGLQIGSIKGLPQRSWAPVFAQIYRDVLANNAGRVETFNGNYGLNRGLAAALISLSGAVIVVDPNHWRFAGGLIGVALVYVYRMHRFGVHFGREVFMRFLTLPPEPKKSLESPPAPNPN